VDVAERSRSDRGAPATEPRSFAPATARRPARRGLVVAAFGGLLGVALFLLARRALIDDAYITLDYARSLAFHGQWALEPGHQANTATSPFNVLLLAGFSLVTRDPVVAAGVLLAMALGVLGWVLSSIGRVHGRPLLLPALGVAAVAVCPLLASTVGMETYLAVALVAWLARAALYRRPVEAGVVVGLLVLTRPDLVAFGLAALLVPALFRRALVVVGVAAAVALPWFVASWLVLGSGLPDTVLLKVGDHWGPWTFGNGLLLYHGVYPTAVLLSVLSAGAGVLAVVVTVLVRLVRRTGPELTLVAVWGVGAALHAGVFVGLGTAPYHWYYGPAIGALTMLAVMSLAPAPRPVRGLGIVAGAALVVVSAGFLVRHPWSTPPLTTNWATAEQYAAVAAGVPAGTVVLSPGEPGTIAYFCDCTVVDTFSDRALVARGLADREAAGGQLQRAILRLNYARLQTGPPMIPTMRLVYSESGLGVATASPWRTVGVIRLEPVPR
jgi:hypothetical protein